MALDYSFYLHSRCNIYFGIIFANFCHLFFARPTEIDVCVCLGARALSNGIFAAHSIGIDTIVAMSMVVDNTCHRALCTHQFQRSVCACVISQMTNIRLSLLLFVFVIFKRGIIKKWADLITAEKEKSAWRFEIIKEMCDKRRIGPAHSTNERLFTLNVQRLNFYLPLCHFRSVAHLFF